MFCAERSDLRYSLCLEGTTEPESEVDAATSEPAPSAPENPPSGSEGGQIMEGVDPSFLAALPADIRQEVIRYSQSSGCFASLGMLRPMSSVQPECLHRHSR